MKTLSWSEFELVDIRAGTIVDVQDFPEARNPSYKIWVDFGKDLGIKKTSAQITELYSKDALMEKQVVGVVNFPPKQIANFTSEFLLTGFYTDKGVVLTNVDQRVDNGLKLL